MSGGEKPLHVQVAEVLGQDGIHWREHRISKPNSAGDGTWGYWSGAHDGVGGSEEIPQYDTDWAATGPLIERLKIDVEWRSATGGLTEPQGEASRNESAPDDTEATWELTPLVAVCRLILALKAAGKLPLVQG